MLGLNRQRLTQVELPIRQVLFGKSRDQIETNVFEPCFLQHFDRAARVIGGVRAAKRDKLRIDERLRADACAIDAGAQPLCYLRFRKRRWIDFDCDFGVRRNVKRRAARHDQLCQLRCIDDRRSTAAKVNRVHLSASTTRYLGQILSPVSYLAAHRVDVAPGQLFKEIGRVEIAIGALAFAEGDVNVDANWLLHSGIISRNEKLKSKRPNDRDTRCALGFAHTHVTRYEEMRGHAERNVWLDTNTPLLRE